MTHPSSSVVASCGHTLKANEELVNVRFKSEDCDSDGFYHTVTYAVYCPSCADRIKKEPEYLATNEEAEAYLQGLRATPVTVPREQREFIKHVTETAAEVAA